MERARCRGPMHTHIVNTCRDFVSEPGCGKEGRRLISGGDLVMKGFGLEALALRPSSRLGFSAFARGSDDMPTK